MSDFYFGQPSRANGSACIWRSHVGTRDVGIANSGPGHVLPNNSKTLSNTFLPNTCPHPAVVWRLAC